jgi:ATP-dependent metalloprotease FtsH
MFTSLNISEKIFFNDYILNTTRVDLYSNKASIYINNNTFSRHHITLGDSSEFKKNLYANNYSDEIYYKYSNNYDLLYILILIMGMRYIQGSSITNFISSVEKSKIQLKDVAGLEDIKTEALEFVHFLNNDSKYKKIGATIPRGLLFHGPPGNGKTLLAKAIAGECDIPFLACSGPDFSELYVGVGASRIRKLFEKARKLKKCIIFIDELDALCRKRNDTSHHEKDNTLNKFLIELDGFTLNHNILIIGATNRLDIIDKALLRPGRFDRKIYFGLPEINDRKLIYEYYLTKIKTINNISTQKLAEQSFGFSGADISNICNEACILAVRDNKKKINQELLYNAIDNILLGREKKSLQLSLQEKTIVAYHEAGHACVSHLLKHARESIKVSILPRGNSALGFSQSLPPVNKLQTKKEIHAQICVLFGGRIAEEIFCDSITTGAHDDISKLTKIAKMYVYKFGMSGQYLHDSLSEKTKFIIDKDIQKLINSCYSQTKKLLLQNKSKIENLKIKLLENETLTNLKDFF